MKFPQKILQKHVFEDFKTLKYQKTSLIEVFWNINELSFQGDDVKKTTKNDQKQ